MFDSSSPKPHQPLSDRIRGVLSDAPIPRRHRGVHHRHGYVFGFPLCSATELDEFLDDAGPANR